jgi:hypothetical protein
MRTTPCSTRNCIFRVPRVPRVPHAMGGSLRFIVALDRSTARNEATRLELVGGPEHALTPGMLERIADLSSTGFDES